MQSIEKHRELSGEKLPMFCEKGNIKGATRIAFAE